MEAAEALGRSARLNFTEAIREWVGSRSRTFWIVAGLTLLAAVLRFATLGAQSLHHDEIVTAGRILGGSFGEAMEGVRDSESAPPLYYALAWGWTQLAGTGEFGLRSLSALAGVATVPVAYLLAAELRDRRAGIFAAALVAVNPMLLWYSQEARGYALLAFLCAASALYFVRALERGGRRDDDLVGGLLGAGARHPLLRDLPGRGRGGLAAGAPRPWRAAGALRSSSSPVSRWPRSPSTRWPPGTRNGSPTTPSATGSGRRARPS